VTFTDDMNWMPQPGEATDLVTGNRIQK